MPAVVDEIVSRTELPDAVWGTPSSDHGSNQAWFEFQSMLGELLDMDFVGLPVYSFGCAAGHAIRMAVRLSGRREVLVPASLDPERLAVIRSYCGPEGLPNRIVLVPVAEDPRPAGSTWPTSSASSRTRPRRSTSRTRRRSA